MSAFVCSAEHIGILAQAISKWAAVMDAQELAEKMALVNVESVDARYAARHGNSFKPDELKIFLAESRDQAVATHEPLSDARLWGASNCYLYQSCESDSCVNSKTYKLVEKYRDYLKAQCAKQGVIEFEGWSL